VIQKFLPDKNPKNNSRCSVSLENSALQKYMVFYLLTRGKKYFSVSTSGLPKKKLKPGQNDPKKCGKDF
jgi:hypothetical protein